MPSSTAILPLHPVSAARFHAAMVARLAEREPAPEPEASELDGFRLADRPDRRGAPLAVAILEHA